jgi:hypothetical protein
MSKVSSSSATGPRQSTATMSRGNRKLANAKDDPGAT